MMNDKYNLLRFIEAQEAYGIYDIALGELKRGGREAIGYGLCFHR